MLLEANMSVLSSCWCILIKITLITHSTQNVHAKTGATVNSNTFCCKGKFAELTFEDCQGAYFNTTACYFLEHFAQYRPCASICNGVIEASIDAEKCQAYCQDYFDQYCQFCKTQTASTASRLTTASRLEPDTQSHDKSKASIFALSLSVVFVGGAICWIYIYRRKHSDLDYSCACHHRPVSQLVLVSGVQESDTSGFEHRRYSPEPLAEFGYLLGDSTSCKTSSKDFSVLMRGSQLKTTLSPD